MPTTLTTDRRHVDARPTPGRPQRKRPASLSQRGAVALSRHG